MIPNDIMLYSILFGTSQIKLLLERLHLATDENRCRDPQPNFKQNIEHPEEEGRKDSKTQSGQSHHRKSQRINSPESMRIHRDYHQSEPE